MLTLKKGDRICIQYMDGEPSYSGKFGIVESIDDAGQIHGSWGGCALIPGKDRFDVISHKLGFADWVLYTKGIFAAEYYQFSNAKQGALIAAYERYYTEGVKY